MELIQSLSQKTSLAMTRRMQNSIRILQMSNQDLSAYLAAEALENPCLDVRLPEGVAPAARPLAQGPTQAASGEWDPVAALAAAPESLYAHVGRQIDLRFASAAERRVAYGFLDVLEPSGWLGASVEEVAAASACTVAFAETVLSALQECEPAGLFARSLAECLRLQARERDVLTWELAAVLDNLPLLAAGDLTTLAGICDCEPEDIGEILAVIRGFDPKPGQAFTADRPPVFPPDLTARKGPLGWEVELNRSHLPSVAVSADALSAAAGNSEARAFSAQAMSSARWLVHTLERRQATLLQTATAIVRRQTGFLEHGPGHLNPLSLEDIAGDLGLHASTISRATSGRMIDTPRGAFPLKTFFCRAFPSGAGQQDLSQDAVLSLVRTIVAAEDPARPLSDTAIAKRAQSAGTKLARRTVTKYREALGIPSSYDRRRKAEAGLVRAS
ncbi:MAG: RNA polymerase factor sigma-54 [Pseudomonadota bacterium]|jgi:RNA polymerase sigma-54 factor|nr:RNA polymerase factor sigma-54 [Pseudomonadota bacterium]